MSEAPPDPRAGVVNGVDVPGLMDIIEAIEADGRMGFFNFRASNTWLSGEQSRSVFTDFTGARDEHGATSRRFEVEAGEPELLLGRDLAPSPAEWVLHALVSCMTTSTVYHAAARGIEIKAIRSDLDGDIDLRGFLGLSDQVRKGYSVIRVAMRVETAASEETIRSLTEMSPVLEMISRSVPVSLHIDVV